MRQPSAGPVLSISSVVTQPGVLETGTALRSPPQPRSPPLSAVPPMTAEALLEQLHVKLATHPFWEKPLLKACRLGHLTREDYALVFSQYALLLGSHTRFLHALVAQCETEPERIRLTQTLWEEVGLKPEKRPAALFHRFLKDGLGVNADTIRFHDATRYFVRECLDTCLGAPQSSASAFVTLGMEALVPRLYSIFVDGLLQANVSDRYLPFFYWHMAASPGRLSSLEALVLSHAHEPGWADTCLSAMERALELHGNFLEGLFETVHHRRLRPLLERIQARLPLTPEHPDPDTLHLDDLSRVLSFYQYSHEEEGIDFSVDRVPFPAEVLETNVVRVAPGHTTELREHAHEVLFVVMSGMGRMHVRGTEVEVKPGDAVFVPRWAANQARSLGPEALTLLSVTDHGFTRLAHDEEVLRAMRLKRATGVDL
ncbi:cupin domain-containing protein [Stigmatella aurantiaca]|uniref:Cupin domain protein n=1 Tax=Stigmatella aurantiaca (strain DW4/3-1) TaxID=378806 RepID=Q097T2_STIAD|nr:cupin domain-containing protein [Stigmatella aurantiaca]ADO68431.1 Cupin domain protein [Stigmatella aurantiaca DW4/3-1]EAU68001.1 cupin domain protein [Stigmatella aurantiaca DW4/3-1]